jgi:hypothetical protein
VQPLAPGLTTQRDPRATEAAAATRGRAALPTPRQADQEAVAPSTSRHFVDFRPDNVQVVQVRIGDIWLFGTLEGFGPGPGGTWRGLVRWSELGGRERRQWFDERDIRPMQV